MSAYKKRQGEIVRLMANKAYSTPLLESGLWFHDDIRNNFYYASYLLAGAGDSDIGNDFDGEEAGRKAESVMLRILSLQDRQPHSATYGHWPLRLDPSPEKAEPHVLPAELMGILLAYFRHNPQFKGTGELMEAADQSLEHLYRSAYHRMPVELYNHHEAKYTASKLVFGYCFNDDRMLEDGRRSLHLTLERLKKQGMPEYGCLPWFWHWVQAFTCAYECVDVPDIRKDLNELLNYLWNERSLFYLRGAWAGAHSRGLAHDLPRDCNVAFDYVQFGDFELPEDLPRIEYAGFLFHEAPQQARQTALLREKPAEVMKAVHPSTGAEGKILHSYVYITERFAAGGMWERVKEFDNEQHRWEVTFPLSNPGSVNRLYFFQPGEGYKEGDPRHQSGNGEMLYHRNAVMALYPANSNEADDSLLGVLPKGEWLQTEHAVYGYTFGVYVAVYLSKEFRVEERKDRIEIRTQGRDGTGVVVEVIDAEEEANRLSVSDLNGFMIVMEGKRPQWGAAPGLLRVDYLTRQGTKLLLELTADNINSVKRMINDMPVDLSCYQA
ncbi:hypothetical protein AB6A23_18145 [Paenibacillus tarimensis]